MIILGVSLRAYALYIVMAAMLGVFTVLQKSDETSQRYKLAKLLLEEKKLDEELVREQARLAELISPQNLERLNQELELGLLPLRKYQPGMEQKKPQDLYAKAVKRRTVQRQVVVPLPEFDAPAKLARDGVTGRSPAGIAAVRDESASVTPESNVDEFHKRVARLNALLAQQDVAHGVGAAPVLSGAVVRGIPGEKTAGVGNRQGR